MKLVGADAIEYARASGVLLSSYGSDETDARHDLSADEAWEIAAGTGGDESLIYIEVGDTDLGLARYQAGLVVQAIWYHSRRGLASLEEGKALLDIFHVEGFGGAEAGVRNPYDATRLARERLDWLRENSEEVEAGDHLSF